MSTIRNTLYAAIVGLSLAFAVPDAYACSIDFTIINRSGYTIENVVLNGPEGRTSSFLTHPTLHNDEGFRYSAKSSLLGKPSGCHGKYTLVSFQDKHNSVKSSKHIGSDANVAVTIYTCTKVKPLTCSVYWDVKKKRSAVLRDGE